MKNISELAGLIKGINFDGVVNQKEVSRLQNWVDLNRNLACTAEQIYIINTIDKILADNIVTDDERQMLEECVDVYLSKESDINSKINELNGIIDGIICDKELNNIEIYRLKDWINNNEKAINQYEPSRNISTLIKKVLSDGIITELERHELYCLLSNKIGETQFETKLNYLCKKVRQKKIIGLDLIDLLDDRSAIQEIHRRAETDLINTLRDSYCAYNFNNPEIIMVSLILIAMMKYDGNYYQKVENTYTKLYGCYSDQKIMGAIRSLICRYRKKEKKSSKERIINYVLSNSIVPGYFLPAFFEFIYDIYKLNFEYTLSDDLVEDFRFVYENLRNKLEMDNDELSLSVTSKSYKLIKSTKNLIMDLKGIDSVIELSIIVLKLIDQKFWDKEFNIYNPYLLNGFNTWSYRMEKENNEVRNSIKKTFVSSWEPKFVLENGRVYLIPPVHKIKDKYSYSDINIIITNNGKKIYVNSKPDIRQIIGGYRVTQDKILLENPLGNLRYEVKAGNDVIYDSKEILYRKYLVFNSMGVELKNNTEYKGIAYFCYQTDNVEFDPYYQNEYYKLSSKNVSYTDPVMIEGEIFNFTYLLKPGIFGNELENHYVKTKFTEKNYKLYKRISYLVFESNTKDFDYEIHINDKHYKIIDFKHTITERVGVYRYVLDLNIKEAGIYNISVYKNNKKQFNFDVCCDPNFKINLSKIDEKYFNINIQSSFIESEMSIYVDVTKFEDRLLEFHWKKITYYYVIPFDLDVYKIDDGVWKTNEESIWIDDIKDNSVLSLRTLNINQVEILSERGKTLIEPFNVRRMGNHVEIPIGFIRTFKETHDFVRIYFLKNGKLVKGIYCFNRCTLNEKTDIRFDWLNKILSVNLSYDGVGQVYYELIDEFNNLLYRSDTINNGYSKIFYDLKFDCNYIINIYEKGKGLLKKNRLLKTYQNNLEIKNYYHHYFKLKEAFFNVYENRKMVEKTVDLKNVYIKLIRKINNHEYIGKMYLIKSGHKNELKKINPLKIEVCSESIDDSVDVSITNDGDGLFIDINQCVVRNTLVDMYSPDIISYTMSLKGVKNV